MRALVVFSRSYAFTDDKTGKPVEGGTLVFLGEDPTQERDAVGHDVIKVNVSRDVAESITQAPAIYDLETQMRPGPGGKGAMLQVTSGRFLRHVNLADALRQAEIRQPATAAANGTPAAVPAGR